MMQRNRGVTPFRGYVTNRSATVRSSSIYLPIRGSRLAVGHLPSKQVFAGSNPVFRSHFQYIVPWCNGSTTDFGSVCPGSNPGGTTNRKEVSNIP